MTTPFTIDVPASLIERIRDKVRAYEWHEMPEIAPGEDRWAYGCDRNYLQAFCAYWLDRYDWRAAERELNAIPQFKTTIDGQEIHYLHVRGSGSTHMALVLTHGWPGSVYEFYGVVERLAHPQRYGGTASDGIDVVVPSLPGFGFSGKPARPIGPRRVAALWDKLLRNVLGYERYVAQGGDWGAYVSGILGLDHAPPAGGCAGIHLNMYGLRPTRPPETPQATAWAQEQARFRAAESAYSHLQSTKPQTLSYAMMDSPVGVAAWILEKFDRWSDTRAPDGTRHIENAFSKDQLLTNIMIYLVTRSFNTATWIYRGRADEGGADIPEGRSVSVPTGIAVYPAEIIPFPPRAVVEPSYSVIDWRVLPRGGHFAAFEQPALFAENVGAFVRRVRMLE